MFEYAPSVMNSEFILYYNFMVGDDMPDEWLEIFESLLG